MSAQKIPETEPATDAATARPRSLSVSEASQPLEHERRCWYRRYGGSPALDCTCDPWGHDRPSGRGPPGEDG